MGNSFIIILKKQKSVSCLCTHSSEAFHNNIKKNSLLPTGESNEEYFPYYLKKWAEIMLLFNLYGFHVLANLYLRRHLQSADR